MDHYNRNNGQCSDYLNFDKPFLVCLFVCLFPGLINQTPFDSGSEERYTQLTALKRAGYTKEIADAVVFLIRDEYITGQNIVVDGGRSLGLFGDN